MASHKHTSTLSDYLDLGKTSLTFFPYVGQLEGTCVLFEGPFRTRRDNWELHSEFENSRQIWTRTQGPTASVTSPHDGCLDPPNFEPQTDRALALAFPPHNGAPTCSGRSAPLKSCLQWSSRLNFKFQPSEGHSATRDTYPLPMKFAFIYSHITSPPRHGFLGL
jgi:hypothetical protein